MAKITRTPRSTNRLDLLKAYDYTYQTRNLEIRLFWQRSNYFLVLNTAIAGGIFLKGLSPNLTTVVLALLGALVSVLWYGVNLGSKFWQTRWEAKLAELESKLSKTVRLFNTTESGTVDEVSADLDGKKDRSAIRHWIDTGVIMKPSVSRNMIWLSLLFALFYTSIIFVSFFKVCR